MDKISLLCDKLHHIPDWGKAFHNVWVELIEGKHESILDQQKKINAIYTRI
jgi:hypothetical protein